jgi:two-component system, NarL family, nitrate/nitrite response regulator NarL
MMRVFVVSRFALHREGLCTLLATREGFEVVGAAADVPDATRLLLAAEQLPEVVLFDMSAPDAAFAARWLIDELPDARVVAIGVPNRERELVSCAEIGVAGFVTCDASFAELVRSLEALSRGEMLCSPAAAAALLRRLAVLARDAERPAPLPLLTAREQEILTLLGEGLSNKQIAQRLCIALPTVRNHVHSILGKLNLHRRAEAAALIHGHPGHPLTRVSRLVPTD